MDKTKVKVNFEIWGDDFNVENASKILDIYPSKIRNKRDKSTYSNVKIKKTSWSFSTDYQESLDINEQLKFITNILNDKKQELQKIKKSYNVNYQISIVIKIENNQSPAIYLESDIIRLADEIQAEFDIDLYVMS